MTVRVVKFGLLLFVTVVTLIVAWSTWTVREARQAAISGLQLTAESGAAQIGHALRALELVMRTTSVHVVATGAKEGLQPYLKHLTARLPPVRTVTVISPDGVIRTDLRPGEPAKGYKVPDRAYFRAHLPPGAVSDYFYSPPIKSRLDGLTQLTLSLGARRANGDLVAVVVSSIDDRYFAELGKELKTRSRYDGRILYKDGRDVYVLNELAPAGGEHGVLVDILARLLDGSETFHRHRIAIPYTDLRFQLSLPAVSYLAQAAPLVVRGSLIIGVVALLLAVVWGQAHRARLQRMASEKRFQDFAEGASDFMWAMDETLRFSFFSDQFTKITGVPQAELLGKTRQETGLPDIDPEVWEEHLRTLDAHESFLDFIHPRTLSDGSEIWLAIGGKAIFATDGSFLGYRGTGRNVTARIQAEEALRRAHDELETRVEERTKELKHEIQDRQQADAEMRAAKEEAEVANRAKSEFLSSMSHDLRSPLNSILGFAEMINLETLGPIGQPKYAEYVSLIHDSGSHLLNLVNDILDLSKLESGHYELEDTFLDPRALSAPVLKSFTPQIKAKTLNVVEKYDDRLARIRVDERALTQILTNLISNAIKFTPAEGTIEISWSLDNHGAGKLEVRDNGIGIPATDMNKVLEPFSQGNPTIAAREPGTGLGLPICKRLCDLHQAAISIDSQPGTGTVVTVVFPAGRTQAAGIQTEVSAG